MNTYYLERNKDYHSKDADRNNDSSTANLVQDTVVYYNECHYDYLFSWCNTDNLAYWGSDKPYHHQALLNMNRELYKAAAIQANESVLDAGCGLGGSSLWMATEHGNQVTGISLSKKQIDYARNQAKKRKLADKVDFQMADFCQTPFADESFDVVWVMESSCYALNKDTLINEAYRLLKKGGKLILCDAFMLRRQFNEQEWQTVMQFLTGWMLPNLSDREEFNGLLQNAGFNSQQVLPSSKHMYKTAKKWALIQKVNQWLGFRSDIQINNYQNCFVQYELFHKPILEYCIFVARK